MQQAATDKTDGYYDPDSPNYWKLASAKRGHTQMVERIWGPGDTYHVCLTCQQQVNVASDGRQDCDAAVLIHENERLEAALAQVAAERDALAGQRDGLLDLLARTASYLDYMEDRGYSSVRVIRSEVAQTLRAAGYEEQASYWTRPEESRK
jgi:hypothetical protein